MFVDLLIYLRWSDPIKHLTVLLFFSLSVSPPPHHPQIMWEVWSLQIKQLKLGGQWSPHYWYSDAISDLKMRRHAIISVKNWSFLPMFGLSEALHFDCISLWQKGMSRANYCFKKRKGWKGNRGNVSVKTSVLLLMQELKNLN